MALKNPGLAMRCREYAKAFAAARSPCMIAERVEDERSRRRLARVNEILAEKTGQTVEKISTDTDRDFILDAYGAKDYGIVDEVIESRKAQEQAVR